MLLSRNAMNKDFELLIKCLKTQNNLYSEILKLSMDKRKMIVENDVASMDVVTGKEESIISQLSDIENIRINCVNKISAKLGINKDVSVSKIIAYAGEYRQELQEKCDDISEVLKKLKAANEINNELIKAQLEYIETVKSIVVNDTNNNYGEDGKDIKGQGQNINLFDRMV